MSIATSGSGEASESSGNHDESADTPHDQQQQQQQHNSAVNSSGIPSAITVAGQQPPVKKKRNLPGMPDPDAEVIALSPKTLMATNRFLCEICGKGFQRDQNLQLHRRGHNLPWKLKQRTSNEPRKRVYICPETSCVHHNPSRALGDLTGIKKHFCRKHGEKKWKCDKCNKRYAVQSDWKAHSKTCGTREYRCDCGTLFSRRDSFITHRAFCDALTDENARVSATKQGGNNEVAFGIVGSAADQASALVGGSSPAAGSYTPPHMNGGFCNLPDVDMNEEAFTWLPPKWNQSRGACGLGKPPTAKRQTSLLPGSGGGGPGPPSYLQGDNSSLLNAMNVGGASNFMHPPKNNQVGSGLMPTNYGHLDVEASHLSSSNLFYNPFSSGMPFPGLHCSSPMDHPSAHLAEISDLMGNSGRMERSSATAGPSFSSNGCFSNGSSLRAANETGKFLFPSSTLQTQPPQQQQQQPSSQMSATALLQKAAQMGATASNPFLTRGFGIASTDSGSFGLGAFWQGPRQEQLIGGSMSNLSSGMISSNMASRLPHGDQNDVSGDGSSSGLRAAQGRTSGAISGYADMIGSGHGLNSFPPVFGSNSNAPGSIAGDSMNQLSSSNKLPRHMSGLAGEFNQSKQLSGSVLPKVEGADRLTRDFLGMNGSDQRSGRQLSHKDLTSLVSIRASGEANPFNRTT